VLEDLDPAVSATGSPVFGERWREVPIHPDRIAACLLGPHGVLQLHGPPASGKSTIAERLVATRPLALRLDLDVVRGLLGAWIDQPTDAGLAAREIALAMARTHLAAGLDVIVPQFLARPEFIEQLEGVAVDVGVPFVEIALMLDRDAAIAAFAERRTLGGDETHRDAETLVDRSDADDPVGEMSDRYLSLLASRPQAHRVAVVRGDVDVTVAEVEAAIAADRRSSG